MCGFSLMKGQPCPTSRSSTSWKSGTQEPGALCIAGLNKYLWDNGAWTSFLINKLKALQKYLGVYTVLGFPMDTGKGGNVGPSEDDRQGKAWVPHPACFKSPGTADQGDRLPSSQAEANCHPHFPSTVCSLPSLPQVSPPIPSNLTSRSFIQYFQQMSCDF